MEFNEASSIQSCITNWLDDISFDEEGYYCSGYLKTDQELEDFLSEYRVACGITFSVRTSKSNHNNEDGKLYWSLKAKAHPIPFIGYPFSVQRFETRQGTVVLAKVILPKK